MEFIDRLNDLCKSKGISKRKLEQDAGLGTGSTSKWSQFMPNQTSLKKVADYFGVSVDYLLGDTDDPVSEEMIQNLKRRRESQYVTGLKESKSIQIPVLGTVVAGIPVEAVEEILDYEDIPEEMSYLGQYFGLKIQGHSMEPRILEGDVVIVRKQEDAESGDLVIVLVNGDSATCKKLIDAASFEDKLKKIEVMHEMGVMSDDDYKSKKLELICKEKGLDKFYGEIGKGINIL